MTANSTSGPLAHSGTGLPYQHLNKRTVLITGANRGLGLGVAKALVQNAGAHTITVILTARNADLLRTQAESAGLRRSDRLHFFGLDVSSDQSVDRLSDELHRAGLTVDAILNNAGIIGAEEVDAEALTRKLARHLDERERAAPIGGALSQMSAMQSGAAQLMQTFNTNAVGAFRVASAFLPGMVKRKFGRIVNVSSGMGGIREMEGGYLPYRVSKSALNAITRVLHAESHEYGVLTNSVCPGWVRTDMGGSEAERSIEEGIYGLLWAITLPADGPSGGFFRDGQPIEW